MQEPVNEPVKCVSRWQLPHLASFPGHLQHLVTSTDKESVHRYLGRWSPTNKQWTLPCECSGPWVDITGKDLIILCWAPTSIYLMSLHVTRSSLPSASACWKQSNGSSQVLEMENGNETRTGLICTMFDLQVVMATAVAVQLFQRLSH